MPLPLVYNRNIHTGQRRYGMKKIIGGAVIAGSAAILASRCIYHAKVNTEHMYDSISYGLSLITRYFEIEELDAGEYADMQINPLMRFHVEHYRIKGLGNLAVMSTNMTAMQMSTFVITPYQANVPLASCDLMYIMGKRKFLIEFYDLVRDPGSEGYSDVISHLREMEKSVSGIPDMPLRKGGDGWLDECRKVFLHKQFTLADDTEGTILFTRAMNTYLDAAAKAEPPTDEDRAAQLDNTRRYVDRLIEESGASTKVFKQAFGKEMTSDFFHRVFFGDLSAG